MSDRASTVTGATICSGAAYAGVPMKRPVAVWSWELNVADSGQPEVQDANNPVGTENQVGRLHVAVDDAALVGVFQAAGRLGHVTDGQRAIERAARRTRWARSSPST